MDLTQYIRPEMLVLVPVLYVVGAALKKSPLNDTWIPVVLGGIGMALGVIGEIGLMGLTAEAVYTGAAQGILCAGASVYMSQVIIQSRKAD